MPAKPKVTKGGKAAKRKHVPGAGDDEALPDVEFDTQTASKLLREIGDNVDTRRAGAVAEGDNEVGGAEADEQYDEDEDAFVPPEMVQVTARLANAAEALEQRSALVATQQSGEQHLFIGHNRNSVATLAAYGDNAFFYADKLGVVTKVTLSSSGVATKQLLLPHPDAPVCSMAVSNTRDGRTNTGATRTTADLSVTSFVAVGLKTGVVRIWASATGAHVGDLTLHRTAVTSMAFRHGTSVLITASDDKVVRTWSVHHMTSIDKFFGHTAPVNAVHALHNERAVTCGDDRMPRLWKLDKATQVTFFRTDAPGDCIGMLDESTFVVGTRNGSLIMYDVMKRAPVWIADFAHGYGWTGDGTGLERQHRTFTEKFGLEDAPESGANSAFGNPITALTVMPYSDLVASGSCDGFVKLWRIIRLGDDPANPFQRRLDVLGRVAVFGFVNAIAFLGDRELICGVGKEPRLGRWNVLRAARNGIQRVPLDGNATPHTTAAKKVAAAVPAPSAGDLEADAARIAALVGSARRPTALDTQLDERRGKKDAATRGAGGRPGAAGKKAGGGGKKR